jgi:hypothetical protein
MPLYTRTVEATGEPLCWFDTGGDAETLTDEEIRARFDIGEGETYVRGRIDLNPEAVDMAQARLALLRAGVTADMVEAQIALMPSPQKEAAVIEWEYRTRIRRDSPLVATIGPALGLTEEQIDSLFRIAQIL